MGTAELGSRIGRDATVKLFEQYAEAGGNFFDTAHTYASWIPDGLGKSERVVGEWLRRDERSRWIVGTKGGHCSVGDRYARPDAFMAPELVRRDLAESLERLQLDWVDLYSFHRDDPRVPVGEQVDLADEFVESGRAKAVGVSNWGTGRLGEALEYSVRTGKTKFVGLQNQWSLAQPNWTETGPGAVRFIPNSEVDHILGMGVAVYAYSPTANGYFATGGQRGEGYRGPANDARLARAQKIAEEKGVTPNQVALAWLLSQPLPVVALLGTGDPQHLADALRAPDLLLSDAERDWLLNG